MLACKPHFVSPGAVNILKTSSVVIFFDGYLPPSKRSVRLERVHACAKELEQLHALYLRGLDVRQSGQNFTDSEIEKWLSKEPDHKGSRTALSYAFLIPVVLDALRASQYSETVKIVPGEADAYCADYVRQNGGTVLSNDSDLVLYDLGHRGEVAFLEDLELSKCTLCQEASIEAEVLQPTSIEKKLKVCDVRRFAFEINLLNTSRDKGRKGIVQRAGSSLTPAKEARFIAFLKPFTEGVFKADANADDLVLSESIQHLDPRISEFVLQVQHFHDPQVSVYLPVLVEDPTKSTAWDASWDLRCFAYSLVLLNERQRPIEAVLEYSRRNRIRAFEVKLMGLSDCIAFAEGLTEQIEDVRRSTEQDLGPSGWRAFALKQVLSRYLVKEQHIPVDDLSDQLLDSAGTNHFWSWRTLQFDAEMQAVLYALRQIKQILGIYVSRTTPTVLVELAEKLKNLPSFATLIPARGNPDGIGLDIQEFEELGRALVKTAGRLQPPEEQQEVAKLEGNTLKDAEPRKKTKRNRRKEAKPEDGNVKEKQSAGQNPFSNTNNRFNVLEDAA